MSAHLSPLADVLTATGTGSFLLGLAVAIARSVQIDRRHDARLARYEEARQAAEAQWQGLKTTFPDCAREVPPEWDEHVVTKPKNPHQGEDDA